MSKITCHIELFPGGSARFYKDGKSFENKDEYCYQLTVRQHEDNTLELVGAVSSGQPLSFWIRLLKASFEAAVSVNASKIGFKRIKDGEVHEVWYDPKTKKRLK